MVKNNQESVCFIGRTTEILPIKDADNIEQIKIGEYSCISRKNTFFIGELCILITNGAVLPEEVAIKTGVKNYLRRGNRVKTVKLKGVWSECIVLKINALKEIFNIDINSLDISEGMDMENILNIKKYEEPEITLLVKKPKKIKIRWNNFYKKSTIKSIYYFILFKFINKLTEIKDIPGFNIYYKFANIKNTADNYFSPTELVTVQRKIHGSNIRVYANIKGEYLVGSHRMIKRYESNKNTIKNIFYKYFFKKSSFYPSDIWTNICEKYNVKNNLFSYIKNYNVIPNIPFKIEEIELYGEVYGAGVQGDYNYGLRSTEVVFFDIQINGKYISPMEVLVTLKGLKLPMVPVLEYSIKYKDFIKNMDYYVERMIPESKMPEEGVVVKANIQGNKSLKAVKVINPYYLEYADKKELPDFH